MPWLYVILAGIVEVFWVLGLKYSDTVLLWIGTIILIVISFYLIIKACELLPSGTVYAVFTGMGAGAIVLIDFVMVGGFTWAKLSLIVLILLGVVGIKLTTDDQSADDFVAIEEGGN